MAVSHLVASAVQGLTPDGVSVLDMDGQLLSRPVRSNRDESQITSETLELRQQLERDLVSKINSTLDPLLGSDRFRAGAFVDCDLTSSEQQEETFDPGKSVMASSQKTEDSSDRASVSGIPGTASNLPHPPPSTGGGSGEVSRRTENVTYETSRVVRKIRIPQGIIKRMSLSVLVGQEMRWQGEGKGRRRVAVPPDPETLKAIKELVAGVTGFDPDRGDQMVVDSLPFEGNLLADPLPVAAPATGPGPKTPQWQVLLNSYWRVILLAVVGVVVIAVMVIGVSKKRRSVSESEVELQTGIGSSAPVPEVGAPGSSGMPELEPALENMADDILGRSRQSAQKDPNATASVLRMWLQDQR
jgi:flagellar M-ring protein FliF